MSSTAAVPIRVAPPLRDFVDGQVLPRTGVSPERFWAGLQGIVDKLGPRNACLLAKRDTLQVYVDDYHRRGGDPPETQADHLRRIGYLEPAAPPFAVSTVGVDAEIASIGGPQLVCPVDNARFIINAANARWVSLLDSIYGTNALLGSAPPKGPYDAARGAKVWDAANGLLDEIFPLAIGCWRDVESLEVRNGALVAGLGLGLTDTLASPEQLVGLTSRGSRWSILLQKHGLHTELVVERPADHALGAALDAGAHRAGLVDIVQESAVTAICDFEDSACTVDVHDKVAAYSNWLGLMDRTISCELAKPGKGGSSTRRLAPPRAFTRPDGGALELPGQALLLARNVGMHMPTDMVTAGGAPIPEHFVDALVTAACAIHDVRGHGANSRHGSIYIVKPKMHGPHEVRLAADLFAEVERTLQLPAGCIKMGVMDEERRTSANLSQCMHAARERLVFVNTGFLDRTADEIHTSMLAGPMVPKGRMKGGWYNAYESNNVSNCLAHRLVGVGQIGKGMWAEPDDMASMLATKGDQLAAGGSTGWVPSPTAASLHALHYYRRSVAATQAGLAKTLRHAAELRGEAPVGAPPPSCLDNLLDPPIMSAAEAAALTADEVQREVDNNVQSLLGYVVRWVGQGVGCSKVPDLSGAELMEDRATLRISSQHLANWHHHGLVSRPQLLETFERMALVVDEQNASDKHYRRLAPAYAGPEWDAALALVFDGLATANGYTEPCLAKYRRARKALDGEEAAAAVAEEWVELGPAVGSTTGQSEGRVKVTPQRAPTLSFVGAPKLLGSSFDESYRRGDAYRRGDSIGGAMWDGWQDRPPTATP